MYVNDEQNQIYEGYKRIMPKTKKRNSGGYVRLPVWLINKEVIITHQDSVEGYIKKVSKNSNRGFLSFPIFVVGLLVKIQYKNVPEGLKQ